MAKILLVEDNTDLRFTVAEGLRMENFDVIEATNGDEAFTILNSLLDVDLVLTDIQMPGELDGLKLSQLVKQKFPELPVIVTSGAIPAIDTSVPVSAFLPKPYDFDKLFECIGKLLPQRRSDGAGERGLKQARHER